MTWLREGIRNEIDTLPRWGRILAWLWIAVYATEVAALITVSVISGDWSMPITVLEATAALVVLLGTLAGTILWLTRNTPS